MLRHNDVSVNLKPETAPRAFQGRLEDPAACVRDKQPTAMVTAEIDEMALPALVKAREYPWHEDNLVCSPRPSL